jgi:hypothetical protein
MSALEPNRIHTLPGKSPTSLMSWRRANEISVQVSYHLPSSSQIFTTLLPSLQQVYVYPAAPSTSSSSSASTSGSKEEEAWGSIYLKTVVQGVILSRYASRPSDGPLNNLVRTLTDILVLNIYLHQPTQLPIYRYTLLTLAKRT